MAQHDMVVDNAAGAVFRADLNAALQALASNNMAATAPSVTYGGMFWLDISTNPATLRMRNNVNTAWINCGNLAELSYLAGVTSGIQTQINAKAPLSSPEFTGTPTAPTPTNGDRTNKIATMAMFNSEFTNSLAVNGYQKLPSGLIIQWGMINSVATDTPVNLTFPIAFSAHVPWVGTQSESSCLSSGGERNPIIYNNGFTGCTIRMGNACNGISIKWMAIGV